MLGIRRDVALLLVSLTAALAAWLLLPPFMGLYGPLNEMPRWVRYQGTTYERHATCLAPTARADLHPAGRVTSVVPFVDGPAIYGTGDNSAVVIHDGTCWRVYWDPRTSG